MTIESLLAGEPLLIVQKQANPGKADLTGIPEHDLTGDERYVSGGGRVVRGSARQIEAWRSLGIEASVSLITKDGSIANGEFVYSADARLFRVTGVRNKAYGKGRIPDHYSYPMEEITR